MLDAHFGSPVLPIPVNAGRISPGYQDLARAVGFWQVRGGFTQNISQRRNRIFSTPQILQLDRTTG